jgi:hypothetical protein
MADGVKKVSVVDVIRASKGCSAATAHSTYARLLGAGEIGPFALANCQSKEGRGGARTPIPVASAEEIVRLLHALPGDSEFKRNAANVLVRYLGGDETLAAEVSENRAAQEQLAAENPDHPARIFGEAVESGEVLPRGGELGQLCQSIRNELRGLREEMRETHVWSFSNTSKNQRSGLNLAREGIVVGGSELVQLDRDERVIRVSDWLKERHSADVWRKHGHKFKSLFSLELKRAKLEQCLQQQQRPYVTINQGEHRLIYTEADDALMTSVLASLKSRFEGIAERDDLYARMRPMKQRRMTDYF